MRAIAEFTKTTLIGGVLVLIPVYLSVLLLLKALGAIVALVAPITGGLPEALPLREVIAMLLLVAACFACGVLVRTGPGLRAKNAFERAILEKIPGYALIRGLAGKIAGKENEHTFTVVLAEIEDALVPAFLVEDCDEENCAIFVPSVPTPAAGAIYIIPKSRVHLVDVPFTARRERDLEMGRRLGRAPRRHEAGETAAHAARGATRGLIRGRGAHWPLTARTSG
jgi:uncharacterized membrane protein